MMMMMMMMSLMMMSIILMILIPMEIMTMSNPDMRCERTGCPKAWKCCLIQDGRKHHLCASCAFYVTILRGMGEDMANNYVRQFCKVDKD